jgi:Zn-dependent protease
LFGLSSEIIIRVLLRALILILAMPVHECAHGLAATRLGDSTPREQGRLTLNPLAHLDLMGSILLLVSGFGWAKPVMVDMRNFKSPRRDMAITALAGPLSNLLMALVLMLILKAGLSFLQPELASEVAYWAIEILITLVSINIGLAVFNLLPMPPRDGSKILGALLPENAYWAMMRNERIISGILFAALLLGVLDTPLSWLSDRAFILLDVITSPLGRFS